MTVPETIALAAAIMSASRGTRYVVASTAVARSSDKNANRTIRLRITYGRDGTASFSRQQRDGGCSSDTSVVFTAISGLGRQHDASALPAIEATLRRLPEDAHQLALALWEYDSIDADMLAREFLGEEERQHYFEDWRR
jgi:hypothetical protein